MGQFCLYVSLIRESLAFNSSVTLQPDGGVHVGLCLRVQFAGQTCRWAEEHTEMQWPRSNSWGQNLDYTRVWLLSGVGKQSIYSPFSC